MTKPGTGVIARGDGPPLLFVHGSAADASTWTIQLMSLDTSFRMTAYTRGTVQTAEAATGWPSIADQAEEAAVVATRSAHAPVIACGSSFGAVVVIELARRHPGLVRGAVLCEPPLPPSDLLPLSPPGFGCALDRLAAERGGEAAAELFLRAVLSDAGYERMPAKFQQRARKKWRQIRADLSALAAYRVGYRRLGALALPVMLLGGERSASRFRPTLEALAAAIPDAELRFLAGAGHMMHADAHRGFARALHDFAARVG